MIEVRFYAREEIGIPSSNTCMVLKEPAGGVEPPTY